MNHYRFFTISLLLGLSTVRFAYSATPLSAALSTLDSRLAGSSSFVAFAKSQNDFDSNRSVFRYKFTGTDNGNKCDVSIDYYDISKLTVAAYVNNFRQDYVASLTTAKFPADSPLSVYKNSKDTIRLCSKFKLTDYLMLDPEMYPDVNCLEIAFEKGAPKSFRAFMSTWHGDTKVHGCGDLKEALVTESRLPGASYCAINNYPDYPYIDTEVSKPCCEGFTPGLLPDIVLLRRGKDANEKTKTVLASHTSSVSDWIRDNKDKCPDSNQGAERTLQFDSAGTGVINSAWALSYLIE